MNIQLPQDVSKLVKDIANLNPDYDVYLGGGYLRDIYCEKPPKDIDIFFVPKIKVSELTKIFSELKINPLERYPESCKFIYRKSACAGGFSSDMILRGVSRLVGLKSNFISPNQVQIIVYDKILTQEELSNDFDMNICQITWNPLTDVYHYTDGFRSGHEDEIIECLHSYDSIRMWHRYERMESKFPFYEVIGKEDIAEEDKTSLPSQNDYQDSV